MRLRRAFLAPIAVMILLPLATAQAKSAKGSGSSGHHAKTHQAKGPSLKILGLAVDEQDFKPGTAITEKSPVNACYYIFGEAASPSSMLFVGLVEAVDIPQNAPTTVTLTAPWSTQGVAAGVSETDVPFSTALFPDHGHGVATLSGGGSGKDDFYRYSSLQGGGLEVGDGRYAIKVSVEVAKQTIEANGSITVSC